MKMPYVSTLIKITGISVLLYICPIYPNTHAAQTCNRNHTFFMPRQVTTNATLELALSNHYFYHAISCASDRSFIQVQASYFHQESRSNCKIGSYFLPHQQSTITIAEDGTGDIGSLWLGIIAPDSEQFISKLQLAPKRMVNGVYITTYADVSRWCYGLWATMSFAAGRARHTLGACETGTHNGVLPHRQTALEALSASDLAAGKFYAGSISKSGVDDIQFKLGYNYYLTNQDHLGLYISATAPTGDAQTSNVIFEPIFGSTHASVGAGYSQDIALWNCQNNSLSWMLDAHYRFVFPAIQRRSFDLEVNGDWSRYLLVATPDQPALSMSGNNFFTQLACVTPGSTVEFWTALHFNYCAYNIELGYNLWWKQREKICLGNKLDTIGIYDLASNCRRSLDSASQAHISQSLLGTNIAPSDATFTTVKAQDLRLVSGAHPRAVTHTLYLAASYLTTIELNCKMYPTMFGFGCSYEHAQSNAALEPWSLWLKTAVSF